MFFCQVCRVSLQGSVCPRDGAEGESATPDPVPRGVQSQFRIRRPWAVGDTGTSYLAEDTRTNRAGILKVLRLRDGVTSSGRERLLSALNKQAALGSVPGLGLPRSVGAVDGVPWLFRDWVDGESLEARLMRDEQLDMVDAMVVTAQLAHGLDRLHRIGAVHGALRPGHVLLREGTDLPDGVLIDAGMVGANEHDSPFEDLGNVLYMAPELCSGKRSSFRSDLYSLGCVFFEALTGAPPFDGDDASSIVAGHLQRAPEIPRDALPDTVADLLESMLAKYPADRPVSARQITRELSRFLPGGWEPKPWPKAVLPAGPTVPVTTMSASPSAPPKASPMPPRVTKASAMPPPLPKVIVPSMPMSAIAAPPRRSAVVEQSDHGIATAPPINPPPLQRRNDPASIRFSAADITGSQSLLLDLRPKRTPWIVLGFIAGCAAATGAMWGLLSAGQLDGVVGSATSHVAVPAAGEAADEAAPEEAAPEPEATPALAADATEDDDAVQDIDPLAGGEAEESDEDAAEQGTEEVAEEEADASESAEADTSMTEEEPEEGAEAGMAPTMERRLTRRERRRQRVIERRRARRQARRDARQERIRSRFLAMRRGERASSRTTRSMRTRSMRSSRRSSSRSTSPRRTTGMGALDGLAL